MVRLDLSTVIQAPLERCFDLARCIELHLLGTEQTGEQAVRGVTTGLIGAGESLRWRATHFGVRQYLTSRMTGFERPAYFQDTMTEGAFRSMQHDHFFKTISPGMTEMRDVFLFAAPIPLLGPIAERLFVKRYMERFLLHRNAVLKRVAETEEWKDLLPADGSRT